MTAQLLLPWDGPLRVSDHPIARKASFLALPGMFGAVDLVSRRAPLFVGARHNASPEFGGVTSHISTAGSGNGINYGVTGAIPASSSTYSVIALMKPTSVASQAAVWCQGDQTTGPNPQIRMTTNCDSNGTPTAGRVAFFEYNSGMNASIHTGAGSIDGGWHLWIGLRTGSGSAARILRDGVDDSLGGQGSGSTLPGTYPVFASGAYGQPQAADFPVAMVAAFPVVLTNEEIAELTSNPALLVARRVNSTSFVYPTAANDPKPFPALMRDSLNTLLRM